MHIMSALGPRAGTLVHALTVFLTLGTACSLLVVAGDAVATIAENVGGVCFEYLLVSTV
jgi:hypothetical protein